MSDAITNLTVHKLDAAGREIWTYPGRRLRGGPTWLTLEARFNNADEDLHGLQLRRGDRFVETFYSDRWYNVFSVFDVVSGRHKGWYCNITRPARIGAADVWAEDLALDLVVLPNKIQTVLDREEFEALPLLPAERGRALEALDELRALAASGQGPFADDRLRLSAAVGALRNRRRAPTVRYLAETGTVV